MLILKTISAQILFQNGYFVIKMTILVLKCSFYLQNHHFVLKFLLVLKLLFVSNTIIFNSDYKNIIHFIY